MKIIVAGAGIGGLYAAYLFGKKGHGVTVYERTDCLENMRYDWHDDANPTAIKNLGIEIPKESFPKKDWTFISPCGNILGMTQSDENRDFSIERRPFNKVLYGMAKEYSDVVFGKEIKSAYIEDGTVCGVVFADGGVEKCDLVIDSCGVDSPIRRSLPVTYGIDGDVGEEGVFAAYRAFYDAVPDAEVRYTNKVYMKHLGKQGISWCIVDNDPTKINVLVGRIGKLNKEELNLSLAELRKDNPVLGEKLERGGIVCKIPVRRPLDVMVADGYAAIGDAACMTVPLIGSGIVTSLYAAKYLFEAVGDGNDSSAGKLWAYQYKVYADFGAQHCGVDYLKNWLLRQKNSTIDWIFGSGIMNNRDLQETSVGKLIKLTFKDAAEKLRKGFTRLHILIPMALMLSKAQKIVKIAKNIPEKYDEMAIAKWANRLDKACGK